MGGPSSTRTSAVGKLPLHRAPCAPTRTRKEILPGDSLSPSVLPEPPLHPNIMKMIKVPSSGHKTRVFLTAKELNLDFIVIWLEILRSLKGHCTHNGLRILDNGRFMNCNSTESVHRWRQSRSAGVELPRHHSLPLRRR